jgi:Carbon-nitrogen hydrolase
VLNTAVIGVAQWLATPGDLTGNLAVALDVTAELGRRGCDLVVLPELWSSGYDPRTLVEDAATTARPLDGDLVRSLGDAARAAGHGSPRAASQRRWAVPSTTRRCFSTLTADCVRPTGRLISTKPPVSTSLSCPDRP